MAIIEKMSVADGMIIPPDVSKWFSLPTSTSRALRLGLLLAGLGLGLGIAIIMNFCMGQFPQMNEHQSMNKWEFMYIALMLLFGGLGLVIAYLIEQKQKKD